MFCSCGKLMLRDENGYSCICGKRKRFDGTEISEIDAERIKEIKKKYHSKYPNMDDPFVRATEPPAESEETDETFSDICPSERNEKKRRS